MGPRDFHQDRCTDCPVESQLLSVLGGIHQEMVDQGRTIAKLDKAMESHLARHDERDKADKRGVNWTRVAETIIVGGVSVALLLMGLFALGHAEAVLAFFGAGK